MSKAYEARRQFRTDRLQGRSLAPDGLRTVGSGPDHDPEKNGRHMPEMPA